MTDTIVEIFKSDNVKLSVCKFGQLTDAQECTAVQKYTWETSNRLTLEVITLDAAIVGLRIPDRDYIPDEVVLASGSLAEYLHYDEQSLTCSVQSSALRRCKARSQRIWSPYVNGCDLILTKVLLDEFRNLMIRVRFSVAFNNVVRISYQVVSDRLQSLETTHRLVMNLGGKLGGYLGTYDHVVQLNGQGFHQIHKNRIGQSVKEMADDLADLRVAQHIGMAIYKSEQEGFNGIYQLADKMDHQFDSRIIQSRTGRVVEVYSDFKWVRFSTLNDLPDPTNSITPFYASLGVKHIGQIFDLERLIHEVVRHVEGDDEGLSQLSIVCRSSETVNESAIRVLIDDVLLRDIEAKIRALKEEGILTIEEARGIIENLLLMSLDRLCGPIKDSEPITEACVQGVLKELIDETVPKPSIIEISEDFSKSSSCVPQERILSETSCQEVCEEKEIQLFHEYQKHSGIVLQLSATPFYRRCKPKGVYSQPNHTSRVQQQQGGLVYNHSVLLKFGICRAPSGNNSVNKSDSSI